MDRYAKELARQNAGGVCSGCGSALGHYRTCPLLNRESAEERSANYNFDKADRDFLKAFNIAGDDSRTFGITTKEKI